MGLIEGSTQLPISPHALSGGSLGPGTHDRERPFYNPGMQVNRDLSVLLVEAFARQRGREIDVADVLAGAGARSLRLANEVDAQLVIHANDGDPNAIATIKKGAQALKLAPERLVASRDNAHSFLSQRRFDIVDLDPFGSPMPLADSCIRALRHDGLLCLTATDTAALSGTYPRVCRRRYGAWHGMHKAAWRQEVGLRILAAAGMQAAGRSDRAAVPVLSVASGHWMRVVLRMKDSKASADSGLRNLRTITMDEARMPVWRHDIRDVEPGMDYATPVWSGALHDAKMLEAMAERSQMHELHPKTTKLLDLLVAERTAPAFWASLPDVRRALGHDTPRKHHLTAALQDAGFSAAPNHIDPEGVRTNATFAELRATISTAKHL